MATPYPPDPAAGSVDPGSLAHTGPARDQTGQVSGNPKFIGLLIALAGGVVTLIAFFALPLVGSARQSFTALQSITALGEAYAAACQGVTGVPGCAQLNLIRLGLWVPPIMAALVIFFAGALWLAGALAGKRAHPIGSTGIIVVAILGAAPLVYGLAELSRYIGTVGGSGVSIYQVLGTGFWLMIAGLVVSLAGGIVQLAVR